MFGRQLVPRIKKQAPHIWFRRSVLLFIRILHTKENNTLILNTIARYVCLGDLCFGFYELHIAHHNWTKYF